MIQANYFESNTDIVEQFESIIDWNEIVTIYENDFSDHKDFLKTKNPRLEMAPSNLDEAKEFYREILRSTGEVSGIYVSQFAQSIDKQGLKFENGKVIHPQEMVDMIQKYIEAGIAPVAFSRKYGGLGVPNTIKAFISELMYRSDTSITIAVGSMGLASILEKFASQEICEEWIPKFIEKNYTVTMGLSEPDYGSDLPEVKTRAIKDPNAGEEENKWLLTGNKRYQTMACGVNGSPSATLVLARSGSPESGARGLSFFIAEGKDYEVTGIEKKLGLKASATCEVAYENTNAVLVGKEGYGLVKYVMGMLNGARLSVASQGTGISTTAFEEAKKYANERIQFGKPIAEIPAVKKMLNWMERETSAMRCLMIEAAYSVDKYMWTDSESLPKKDPKQQEIKFWEKVANTLTPISKYYNSETCIQVVNTGLQVLGGAGYTEDYDLARLYRDSRITNIYDGTTQIQVNAAIGGIVAGMTTGGVFREYLSRLNQNLDDLQASNPQGIEKFYNEAIQNLFKNYEAIVESYKKIENRESKEAHSMEVVESSARVIMSCLMERARLKTQKLEITQNSQPNQNSTFMIEKRKNWSKEFLIDSMAILSSNQIKLNGALGML
jgi:alkylation response protein AidB-like acyl-CoA dehydrogenase